MNAIVCPQVVQPINGDPFIGMLEVRAIFAALSCFLNQSAALSGIPLLFLLSNMSFFAMPRPLYNMSFVCALLCHIITPSFETFLLPCADTCHLVSLSGWVPLQSASVQDRREPASQRRGDQPGAWLPCHR